MAIKNFNEIINSLTERSESSFVMDKTNRDRLEKIMNLISGEDTDLANLVSILHTLLNKNLTISPFLIVAGYIAKKSNDTVYRRFIDTFEEVIENKTDFLDFVNICSLIIKNHPESLSLWLILVKLFMEMKFEISILHKILINLKTNLISWNPGDMAVKLIHIISYQKSAMMKPEIFIKFLDILIELNGSVSELVNRLLEHYPLPFENEDFVKWNTVRRLSYTSINCFFYDAVFACPIDLDHGILSPGCIKWFDEEMKLLHAGYFLDCRILEKEENDIIINVENYTGTEFERKIHISVNNDSQKTTPPDFFHEVLNINNGENIDLDVLSLFYGFLEAYMDINDNSEENSENKLSKSKAIKAYKISRKFQLYTEIIKNLKKEKLIVT